MHPHDCREPLRSAYAPAYDPLAKYSPEAIARRKASVNLRTRAANWTIGLLIKLGL